MTTLQEAISNGRGIERAFHCEVHDNQNTPAASVNVALGVWVCYSCGAAGRTNGKVSRAADVTALAQSMLMPGYDQPVKPGGWLELFDSHHASPYWVKRVGLATAELYRCGTHPTTFNPTYPLSDLYGQVYGVVQRTDSNPKYLYPPGVPVSGCLFGWEYAKNATGPLLVVEGASDVMTWHHRLGVYAVGVFGAGVKQPQAQTIKSLRRRVLIAFDNDAAGQQATESTTAMLTEIGVDVAVFPWEGTSVKDVEELSKDELEKRMNDGLVR